MTDTVFPTGFSTLTVSTSLVLFGDDGTNNGNVTIAGLGTYLASNGAISTALAAKPALATTTPAMNGAAAVGTGTTAARADHVHASDTSREATANKGAANGYAGLDGSSFVPTGNLPIVPIAKGGTGTATPGIVAGTNVTVSGSWPNQTVNATAGFGTGTVNSGTAGRLAFYAGTGTAVSELILGTNLSISGGTTLNAAGGGGSSGVPVTTVASSGASQALAFPAGGSAAYDVTLTGNCVFTITGGTAGQDQTIRLYARGGTGGFTPSFPAGVVWVGGVAPSGPIPASAVGIFTFRTPDAGTTIFGEF